MSIVDYYSTTHHLEIEHMLLIYAYYFSIYIYVGIYIIRCLSILIIGLYIYMSVYEYVYTIHLFYPLVTLLRKGNLKNKTRVNAARNCWVEGRFRTKSAVSTTLAFVFMIPMRNGQASGTGCDHAFPKYPNP
jgi:hypothetical protein